MAILPGATPAQQQRIGERLLAVLREAFARAWDERPCDITVDLREMRRETYCKAMNDRAREAAAPRGDRGLLPGYRWNRYDTLKNAVRPVARWRPAIRSASPL